ncbi:MAG: hypothetical protein JWN53_1189 [Gemmatimonadetes bacterium]|jgi:membrane-associated phospholipid phosphatase|nr:hypothetical protein [Gemmatimonadota bacterium]
MTSASHEVPVSPWRTRLAKLHPRAYLALHLAAGVLLAFLLIWAFAAIADAMTEQSALVRVDHALTNWIQQHDTEWGESAMSWVAWLGAPVLTGSIAVATVVFMVRRDWLRASTVAISGIGAALLNNALKMIFHRGRPEYATEFISRASWSFPSGHAMDSLAGYGIIAWLLLEWIHGRAKRSTLIVGTIVLVVAIGTSRVYLGVHYLSDVIAGYLAGGVWLLVCVSGYRFARLRLGAGSPGDSAPASARTAA